MTETVSMSSSSNCGYCAPHSSSSSHRTQSKPKRREGRRSKKNLPCVRGKRRECWLSSLFAGWQGRCLFWGRIRPRKFCLFPINKSTIRVQNTFSLQKVFGDSLAPAVSPKARSRNLSPLGKGKGERESPLYAFSSFLQGAQSKATRYSPG